MYTVQKFGVDLVFKNVYERYLIYLIKHNIVKDEYNLKDIFE